VDPRRAALLDELAARFPPDPASRQPTSVVVRSGAPLLLPEVDDEALRSLCVDEEHARLLRAIGARSLLVVPIVSRGLVLGAVAFGGEARSFGPSDLELGGELAHHAAMALDNGRLYAQAQKAIHTRDVFLLIAAHELRTPLTALQLSVQSLVRGPRSGDHADLSATGPRRKLEIIEGQTKRLSVLVDTLLDVSRLHASKLDLELADVDLCALARDVVARFHEAAARAECQLVVEAESTVTGRWDRSRLEQVITNLLGNAVKFGAGKPIEISVTADRAEARLVVRDHGIGIPEHESERIFEMFGRAVSEHYGGFGLGLFIARQIVQLHGGTISVASSLGEGTTFTVVLPRTRDAKARVA
jgi:signal transduction histidine kinase